jgi:membrane protease YdiL (CAAX protease family)
VTDSGAVDPDRRPDQPSPEEPAAPDPAQAPTSAPAAAPAWPYSAESAPTPPAPDVAPAPAAPPFAAPPFAAPAPAAPPFAAPPARSAGGGPREAWQPRPYPQLLRGPTFRWWRPLASAALMLVGIGLVLGVAVVAGIVIYLIADASGRQVGEGGAFPADWEASPAGMLFTNLLLAALIPLTMGALWAGFGWRPRWLASVVGGVRWGWLALCLGVAVVVLLLPAVVLTALTEDVGSWKPEPQWPALAVVVLLTTPLQAAGEEYLFRGWLPQTIGSVFRSPVVGAFVGGGVASVLFAFAHGEQDPWLFADRLTFGAIACWLVWRTGGLEAGIAVHTVNNLVAFGFTIAQGSLIDSLTVTKAGAVEVLVDVITLVITGAALALLARRRRVVRLFVPPA